MLTDNTLKKPNRRLTRQQAKDYVHGGFMAALTTEDPAERERSLESVRALAEELSLSSETIDQLYDAAYSWAEDRSA